MEILWIIVVIIMVAGSMAGQKRKKELLQKPPVKIPSVHSAASQKTQTKPAYKKEEKKPLYRQTVRYEAPQNQQTEAFQKEAHQKETFPRQTEQKEQAVKTTGMVTVKAQSIEDTPSLFMEQVYDHMTTGYQFKLSYERDFVGEGMDFLNRMMQISEPVEQNTEYR